MKGVSRRRFLAAAAALPALGRFTSAPMYAEEARVSPPYLSLEKFIEPGNDEFPEEQAAGKIAAALDQAMRTGELPIGLAVTGSSPLPKSYSILSSELSQAVFDSGAGSVQDGWRSWIASLGNVRRAQFYPLADNVVRYEVASEIDGRLLYRVGIWKQRWAEGKLVHFEPIEEHIASAAKPYFRDVSGGLFEHAPSFEQQLLRGVPYWRARLDPASGIDIYGSNGIAVGDIDHDGEDEIYVCQPGGLPNRLYKFQPDGTLQDITDAWGVGILDDSSSALFVDLRNIGRQDLVLLRGSGPLLFLNEGTNFRLRTDAFRFRTNPAGAFTGMAAADFDRDGKLDLYLCCYVYFLSEAQYTYASPYHDAQNGPPNFLFRNRLKEDGSGFLEDCTEETGINENNNRFSFAPAWCDFNGDGWPDLYVANDFGRKNLYVNHGGKFRDLAESAGVSDLGPGMSASWFDYDGDGRADLYVANMWTAAGQRLIHDKKFLPAQDESRRDAYRRHTKGNSLYRNRGDGTFDDATAAQHAAFGRWAWSSGGHDLDNDGQPELLVTCGMLTNESRTDLGSFFWRQVVARASVTASPSAAYENGWNALNQFIRENYSWNGHEPNVFHKRIGSRYFDFSGVSGLDFAEDSRAFAICDFDGDGRPDVILKSRMGPQVRVLQNDCTGENRSIAFVLRGSKSNRDAIGARVSVDGQVKWLEAGSGFLSQHSKRMIFGLSGAEPVKRVEITWPSGLKQELSGLVAGQTYFVTEGNGVTEGDAKVEAKPFRARRELASHTIAGRNELGLEDTWFMEPVPLPEKHAGPRLLVLIDGQPVRVGADAKVINFAKESADRRRQYEILRRYLFDWRTTLTTPIAFLLNDDGAAVKVYAQVPSDLQVKADLAQAGNAPALPFAGSYVKLPRRDFFKFGAAFLASGYPEQALPYLEQELRRVPDNARVLVLVGQIHAQAGRKSAAEKCFREAIAANPKYAEAWSGLGDLLDGEEALASYEKALALKPDLLHTLLNAGQTADKLNQQGKAESWYRAATQVDPQSADAANGLGLALAKQGKTDEARRQFERAIALRRDFSNAVNNLGVLYLNQGQVNDAIGAFNYGIGVAPDEDILYLNLGKVYARQGNLEKARQVMQQLLDRKPTSAVALHALQELGSKP